MDTLDTFFWHFGSLRKVAKSPEMTDRPTFGGKKILPRAQGDVMGEGSETFRSRQSWLQTLFHALRCFSISQGCSFATGCRVGAGGSERGARAERARSARFVRPGFVRIRALLSQSRGVSPSARFSRSRAVLSRGLVGGLVFRSNRP